MHIPRTTITFKSGEIRFNYRVGGILIRDEHVLCQSSSSENIFFLPGGRAELGEAAYVSLLREMQEELGVLMKIERLLYVAENFFNDQNDLWHELGFYFLINAPAGSYLNQSLETIGGMTRWAITCASIGFLSRSLKPFRSIHPFFKKPYRIFLLIQYILKNIVLALIRLNFI